MICDSKPCISCCDFYVLDRFVSAAAGFSGIDVADFMFMGTQFVKRETTGQTVKVYMYKNSDTRRYLNLDDLGHAYNIADGGIGLYPDPRDAIKYVLS